jgi:hypothetical protein
MWWWVLLMVTVLLLLLWRTSSNFTNKEIPRTIWTFWDSDTLPPIVEKSIDSWRKHSPDFTIHVVTPQTLPQYLPGVDFSKMRGDFIQRTADFVRVHLVAKYGGIWSDASVVATRSHNWIIHEQQTKGFEFFAYHNPRDQVHPDYPVVANWFFASVPNGNFVTKWRDEFNRINHFENIEDYIVDIRSKGVDTQKIPDPGYLTQDCAAQVVLQTQMTPEEIKKTMHLLNSEDGPYKHSHDNGWDPSKSVQSLCDTPKHQLPDLIKIYGNERRAVETDPQLECVYKIFSPSLE